jgi:hypothetical protein
MLWISCGLVLSTEGGRATDSTVEAAVAACGSAALGPANEELLESVLVSASALRTCKDKERYGAGRSEQTSSVLLRRFSDLVPCESDVRCQKSSGSLLVHVFKAAVIDAQTSTAKATQRLF